MNEEHDLSDLVRIAVVDEVAATETLDPSGWAALFEYRRLAVERIARSESVASKAPT